MSMSVGSVNNVYATYSTQKTNKNSQTNKPEVSQEDYIKELRKKNPQLDIMVGSSDNNVKTSNYTGKTDVKIAPEILNKMLGDSQIAAKYENMLSKIPALNRWADSMIKSMTGSEVKYRQVWIDKDGNMGSMCVTGPSEKQKKIDDEKKKNKKDAFQEHIQKAREKKSSDAEQIEKMVEKKIRTSKDGKIFFDNDDIQLFNQMIENFKFTGNTIMFNGYFDQKA